MAQSIKDQVAVIGVGCIKFGDNVDQGYEDMAVEAAFAAFNDAKIGPEEIDAAWLGTYSPAQGHGKAAVSLGDALRLVQQADLAGRKLLRDRNRRLPPCGHGGGGRAVRHGSGAGGGEVQRPSGPWPGPRGRPPLP